MMKLPLRTHFGISSISAILPCFNEEENIEQVLCKVIAQIQTLAVSFEVIVVDDGSTDESAEIIRRLQQDRSQIKIIRHGQNRGYGETLRSGFDAARNEWILLMDADGQFDIQDIDRFLPYMFESDMILGFRHNRADPFHRKMLTALYVAVIRCFLFRAPFRDISCGFKLFRRSAWQAAQPIISTDHKIFTAEWLSNSLAAGLCITEVPVHHYPRRAGQATGAQLAVIFAMVKAMGKVLRHRRK